MPDDGAGEAEARRIAAKAGTAPGWSRTGRLGQDGCVVIVRYFAAARAAAGVAEETLEVPTLEALRKELAARDDRLARVIRAASFLVDGVSWREAHAPLPSGCTVDILPPFAGG